MIHEIERNYEPRTWKRIEGLPNDARTPAYGFDSVACSSDSIKAFQLMERGVTPFFVDYEILSAGEDPLCGSILDMEVQTGKLVLGIFVRTGPEIMDVETRWFREV